MKNCDFLRAEEEKKKQSAGKSAEAMLLETQTPKNTDSISSSYFCGMAGGVKTIDFDGIEFMVDSGANIHIIKDDNLYRDCVTLQSPVPVLIAKNETYIWGLKRGIVEVTSDLGVSGTLTDVLYCADAPYNLLSVDRLLDTGLEVRFKTDRTIQFIKNGKITMSCYRNNNSQKLKLKIESPNILYTNLCNSKTNYNLWHKRLGHMSKEKFIQLQKKSMVYDVSLLQKINLNNDFCEACKIGKQARLSSKNIKNKSHISRPLQIVHSDICGPIRPPTIDGKKYFMIFVDEFTHYCVTYLATFKSDLKTVIKDYINKSEARFNSKTVQLYIDNGTEYLSNEVKHFCFEKGIEYHLTIPYTPHQNGVSERMIRTITEKARTLLAESKLPQQFWGEAVLTATFLANISPSNALKDEKSTKTPFELWHGKKPMLKHLRVFGSTAFVHKKIRENKFDDKSSKGILVGFVANGYKIFDAETNTFITARDVVFDEVSFLNTRPTVKSTDIDKSDDSEDWLPDSDKNKDKAQTNKNGNITSGFDTPEGRLNETNEITPECEDSENETPDTNKITSGQEKPEGCEIDNNEITSVREKPEGRKIDRNKITSEKTSEGRYRETDKITPEYDRPGGSELEHDESSEIPEGGDNETRETTSGYERSEKELSKIPKNKKRIRDKEVDNNTDKSKRPNVGNNTKGYDKRRNKPHISYNVDEDDEFWDYVLNRAESLASDVPNCFQEIFHRDDGEKWQKAVEEELDSLKTNDTWTLVPRPKNKNIVSCKWTFKLKTDEYGNPVRYKARLVARGFTQVHLEDFNEIFAPIVRIGSLRFIIALANQFNLYLDHLDVKTAFLYGTLEEEIYMEVPEGINLPNKDKVSCKLKKGIYGLKQSARLWFKLFEECLLRIGFKNSSADPCVFVKDNEDVRKNIYVALFVDDAFVACGDLDVMKKFKNYLAEQFSMRDLGKIKYILGIRITRDYNSITLDQTTYINNILRSYNMYDCNAIKTPLPERLEFERLNSDVACNAPSQNLLGSLMYLMVCTRPDLSFAVNLLSRFVSKKNDAVWQYLKSILRFLKGTSDLKLVYRRT